MSKGTAEKDEELQIMNVRLRYIQNMSKIISSRKNKEKKCTTRNYND